MQPVLQEDVSGCGIASMATLAGVTYKQVKTTAARLGTRVTDSRLWSGTTFIRRLLGYYRIKAHPKETPFRSWESLPPLALLAIKWHRKRKQAYWHWVVFRREPDRNVVIDPSPSLKNPIRTDFGRIKPTWIIPLNLP